MPMLPAPRHILSTALATLAALLCLAPSALAAPLAGSGSDTGDGNQDNGVGFDWQGAQAAGTVKQSADANDDCFIGGVKELAPRAWAFNTSAGGCTPGKSNLRVAFVAPETTPSTTFGHFAFFRNDTTGNSFLTFELNQRPGAWTNPTPTTIPCRADGDVLLSFEVGGSSLTTSLYKWKGDGTGPAECRDGASGTFVGSGTIPASRFQGAMNSGAAITNFVNPGAYGASFPANAFGEAAIDLPAVLGAMGQSPCFGFLQMQVHSRSSSSISSAMIDYTRPTPVYLQSCAITGTTYQDSDGDGTRDAGEPGLAGFRAYADLDGDGTHDAGEPSGESDPSGFYRILDVPAGTHAVRQVPRAGWRCSDPDPCSHTAPLAVGGNSDGNDFGNLGPSTASGTAFEDADGDGLHDAGEPALAGAEHFADYDGDAIKDAGEPSGTSNAFGAWSISGIAAGTYTIRPVPRAGWTCSSPAPCASTRTFTSGSSVTALVFGQFANPSIAGALYEDADGDGGPRAGGDTALAGWQVYLDANGNGTLDLGERATSTDATGAYAFAGLLPGPQSVRVTAPAGTWQCTRPAKTTAAGCERPQILISGSAATGQDFAFARTATVSGTSFEDTNGDGVKASGEPLSAGFVYWVDYDGNGAQDTGEPASTSDAAGAWAITGVRAGAWTVRSLPRNPYACTKPTPCSVAVSVTSGAAVAAGEFGYFTARSISGVVFKDETPIGAHTVGGAEPGLADWIVYYDNAPKNGVRDAGEISTTTNALGQYRLTGLGNGQYQIGVVPKAGWTCSYPDGTCLIGGSMGASTGSSEADKDFGAWNASAIKGTVSEDLDGDGAAREPGEGPLAGQEVYVDADADAVRDAGEISATSDATGAYTLPGLDPGTYTVRLASAAGWTCTRPGPCAWTVTVSSGDVTARDFAARSTGAVSGHVYEDADADGGKDAGEPGIAGRAVYLDTDDDGSQDPGETGVTTSAGGDFSFPGLVPGTYRVRQVLPAGWTHAAPTGARTVVVTSRGTPTVTDLGSYTTGSIAGTAYQDTDFDGDALEAPDAGLSGRVLYLDADDDGAQDAGEVETTTAGDGTYAFTDLPPGAYTVRPALPADWACARPAPCEHRVTIASRTAATGRDFGSYVGASIAGVVFEDADGDGSARQAGDEPLAGQRVYLDGDADGIRDPGEPTTVTDGAGAYAFTGVTVTTWQLRLDLGAGFACDAPAPCRHDLTALTSGAAETGRDFGIHGAGSISGHLFTDRDNDQGAQVFGENDQPGRTVFLDASHDGVLDAGERTATTDDLGRFAFTGVEPGTYDVRQVLPAGWVCSTPDPCRHAGVTVSSRQAVTGLEFSSWTTASFSGTYFEDDDADREFVEPGEPGIDGRTVYLDTNANGTPDSGEPTQTTDADGRYAFDGLAPGTYRVRAAAQPDDWSCSYPSACAETLTLEAAEAAQDVDFGAWTTGTVAGAVTDASPGAGGAGLGGWTVFVDADGDGAAGAGEPAATTAADGSYVLTLDPGTYRLRHTGPAGWSCTTPDPCERTVTITSQGAVTGADFADEQVTAVAGTVFEDTDGDREQDAGEAGRAGVTVYADGNDDGDRDTGEPSGTSDAAGAYRIRVIAGAHVVRLEAPADRLCLTAGCARAAAVDGGQTAGDLDFALAAPAAISGVVFEDTDGDGTRAAGDAPLDGRELHLDRDGDGSVDPGEPVVTTASGGTYSFAGLAPGRYGVRLLPAAGWTCSGPDSCDRTIDLTAGQTATGTDLGAWRAASLGGVVFDDRDADGAADTGDDGRAGVEVWVDLDGDGAVGAGEPRATTDAGGRYAFTDAIEPGVFTVRVAAGAGRTCAAPAGCAQELTFTSGAVLPDLDVATWAPATVRGEAFDDADADGAARESGEDAVAAAVWLDRDGNGTRDAGETVTADASTGAYAVTGLVPGTYVLRSEPSGRACTVPASCARTVTVTSAQDLGGQDFGGYAPASLTGVVREDVDADGTLDAGDEPLAGRVVFLDEDGDGADDAGEPTAATDAAGVYAFPGLVPGTHRIALVTGPGERCSTPAGCRRAVTLVSGEDAAADVLAYRLATVSGTVSEDADADGTLDAGETGAGGRTVVLDTDGVVDGSEPATTTDASGAYAFAGLEPGTYVVHVQVGPGWACSAPAACASTVTLGSGEARTREALVFGGATLGGTVLEDADADGTIAAGDAPLAGQVVYADTDGDGARDAGEPSATTAADGGWSLVAAPGTRTVRLAPAAGVTCSAPAACAITRTVTSSQVVGGLRFAGWAPARITGTVADDRDGDGTGEGALAGQTVYLDADDDAVLDAGEPARETAADGAYAFTGLRPGGRVVRLREADGRACTAPASCRRAVTAASGQAVGGQDFASRPPRPAAAPPVVSGVLFEDRDADGRARDAGDPLLAGWLVYVDGNANRRHDDGEPVTSTDARGAYRFVGLAPGDHTLRFAAPSDKWICSLPVGCARQVSLAADGRQVDGQDFAAWRMARITGHKFEDADRDGSGREPGDKPLPGWTVFVDLDRNGRLDAGEPSDVVDAEGRYGLTNLPMGKLTLRELPPAGSAHRCSYPVGGCVSEVRLASGDPDVEADFGGVLGIRQASRRVRVSTPTSCRDGRFRTTVSADLARKVDLMVDGRRRATSRKASRGRYAFTVDGRRYRPGVHKVQAKVTFLDGSTRTARATFHRCRAAAPRYTG